ncbi:MAG TPA: DUF4360 domain-containing protein [Bdellovibrionota bacterium]|nr:DUF4360 domain-containing protein [Bdellovibrionota bacterium]
MKSLMVLGVASVLAGQVALAAVDPSAPVQVGSPAFGGAACPSGTTVAKVVPVQDEDGVSVVGELKPVAARAGGKSGKTVSTQACELTIPVEVAKGFQAALTGAKFEGSYDLPSGSRATVRTERFVAGGAGLKREQNLVAPAAGIAGSYESEMAPEEAVWTSCSGGGYNLRAQTRLVLMNEGKSKPARISIGRNGAETTHMVYKVQWRRCR